MSDNRTPTSLKQMFQEMMPEGAGVVEGTVTRESPLQITLTNDAKMVLSQNSLILPDWLTDAERTIDIMLNDGNIYADTSLKEDDGSHQHDELTNKDGSHQHSLRDFNIHGATMVIYNHLKMGDIVLLLSFNGGKQYYILDRRG